MKKMMKKSNLFLAVILLVMAVISFSLVKNCNRPRFNGIEKSDTIIKTDTLYKYDTLTIGRPVPKIVEKIKIDTVYDYNGTEIPLVTETKHYQDTIIQQKDTAVVRAQVTGINAELDTVSVMFNRREITNTVEITKYVEKKKGIWDKFSIGFGVGYGYGLKNKDIEPFVGVSLIYNLKF